jgi:hypothetical protein
LESPRIKSLGKIKPDDCEIFLVDGDKARDEVTVEFSLGGHSRADLPGMDKIPEGEIWVEDTGSPQDLANNLTHEIVERILMKYAGLDYESAHEAASSIEKILRQEEPEGEEEIVEFLSSIRKSIGGIICRK